jgi:putative transposase
VLSAVSEVVTTCWKESPQHFPQVTLDAFVVMPNHLNGILVLDE